MSERLEIIKTIFRDHMKVKIKEQQEYRERIALMGKMHNIVGSCIGKPPREHFTHAVKGSEMLERLCRYAHNLNIEKVEKYATKLTEHDAEQMDKIGQDTDKYSIWFDDIQETKTEESAYLHLCDSLKCQYDERQQIVALVKKILGT